IGKAIIEHTKGNQYIGVVIGREDAVGQQLRIEGLKDALKSYSNIKIVAVEASGMTKIGAAKATYTLLKEHPNITTLVGMSALDGIGIVEGIEDIAPNKDFYVTAFDTLPDTLKNMQAGKIDMTVLQQPNEMGFEAIQMLLEL